MLLFLQGNIDDDCDDDHDDDDGGDNDVDDGIDNDDDGGDNDVDDHDHDVEYYHSRRSSEEPHRLGRTRSTNASPTNSK